MEPFTKPSRSNSSAKTPADLGSNKNDKWKVENPLKRLLSPTMHPLPQINSNNYSRNSTIMTKSTFGHQQGAPLPKKTDAPMLNLVYDSHIKHRHPDFRWAFFLVFRSVRRWVCDTGKEGIRRTSTIIDEDSHPVSWTRCSTNGERNYGHFAHGAHNGNQ